MSTFDSCLFHSRFEKIYSVHKSEYHNFFAGEIDSDKNTFFFSCINGFWGKIALEWILGPNHLFDNMPPVWVFWVMCGRARGWSRGLVILVTSFMRAVTISTARPRVNRETIYGWNATLTWWRNTMRCVHRY